VAYITNITTRTAVTMPITLDH